ncbi:MAG: hypothetical protein Kow0031_30580 [Anaerolineae bacterium]
MDLNFALITVISMVLLLLIFGGVRWFSGSLTRRWNRHKQETVEQWAAEGVSFALGPTAIKFSGVESLGSRSPNGVGYALLTDTDLRVTCALPSTQAWIVTFRQIKGVALKYRFLGKSAKTDPFVVVRFTKDAETDRLAFQLKGAAPWAEQLAQAARVTLKEGRDDG